MDDDKKLKEYAERQAFNEFYQSGKVEDYNNYTQIKEDIKEVEQTEEDEEAEKLRKFSSENQL